MYPNFSNLGTFLGVAVIIIALLAFGLGAWIF